MESWAGLGAGGALFWEFRPTSSERATERAVAGAGAEDADGDGGVHGVGKAWGDTVGGVKSQKLKAEN